MLLLILFLFQFFIFAIFPNRLILTYMDIDMLKGSLTCQQIGSCMAAACVDASRGHEHSTATSCRYFCVFFFDLEEHSHRTLNKYDKRYSNCENTKNRKLHTSIQAKTMFPQTANFFDN